MLTSFLASRRVDLLLLLVAVVWGSGYLAAKTLTGVVGVPVILSLRFLITAIALGAWWWLLTRCVPSRREVATGIVLGATQAGVLVLETYGIADTSATNAGLIISLTVVFTPLMEAAAAKVPVPRAVFVAGVVAVAGVCLLVSGDGLQAPRTGDVLVLGAALVRSIHVTALAGLTRGRQFSSVNLTLVQAVVCAVVFTAADPSGVVAAVRTFTPAQWSAVLYLGLGCSMFAFVVQTWAIRRTSASRASLLMGTGLIWAVAIGISFGNDTLTLVAAAGAVLIITGTYLGQRAETQHRHATRLGPETAETFR